MEKINPFEHSETILKTLATGAFLTTAAGDRVNTMTIGWGSLGFMWGQQVFTVMVRQSRYTKELIDASPYFTVSFPVKEGFKAALGLCGSKSGRDMDKFAAAGLEAMAGKSVSVPVIKGCGLHLECRIVDVQTMEEPRFNKELEEKWYGTKDWHTYYTGVITGAYMESED